jgi:methionine sulfoxide reductase heme-binding subunit
MAPGHLRWCRASVAGTDRADGRCVEVMSSRARPDARVSSLIVSAQEAREFTSIIMNRNDKLVRYGKPSVFLLCLVPFGILIWRGASGSLGPNPVEAITHFTGDWTLRLLLVTLAVTPLRRLTGQAWLVRFRRMLGLFTFFYAVLHLITYLWLDRFFDLGTIAEDVLKRPYITVGFAAFILMVPLAITSTQGWIRRLGRRWKTLHRAVYVIGVLGVLHYLWLVKADLLEPVIYGVILAVLLAFRVPWRRIFKSIPMTSSVSPIQRGGVREAASGER